MKYKIAGICLAIVCILIFLLYCFVQYIPETEYSFNESKRKLSNPSCGLYYQMDTADLSNIERAETQDIHIALLTFDIHDYTYKAIDEKKMMELQTALYTLKNRGFQIIFRAGYGFDGDYAKKDPEKIETVEYHIGQIAPLLNQVKENILCVQAGFLGPWGEWHSSNLLGHGEQEDRKVRNRVIECFLSQLDESVIINVRRPSFIRDAEKAGISTKRLGIHNDALLSTQDDMGTYEFAREEELEWMDRKLQTGINGGEMPLISEYTKPANVINEFEKIGITYLNSTYNKDVLDIWKREKLDGENAYDTIINRLGYRFYVSSIKEPQMFWDFQKPSFSVTFKNTGFSRIEEGFIPYFIVCQQGNVTVTPLDQAEGRTLETICPGEEVEYVAKPQFDNKKDMAVGIMIAKGEASSNEKYKVELANDNFWFSDRIGFFASYSLQNKKFVLDETITQNIEDDTKSGGEMQSREAGRAETNSELPELKTVFFKIGKADAVLIQTLQSSVLIDTGEDEDAEEILKYLDRSGIDKLDYLILTHFHKDHVGGADKIIDGIPIDTILQPAYESDSSEYLEYVSAWETIGIAPTVIDNSYEFMLGQAEFTVDPAVKNYYEEENDFSMVISVKYGTKSFYYTGDAETVRLNELLSMGNLSHSLLKIPHHGRKDSALEPFIKSANPQYAVITCSEKNHPDQEVLDLLNRMKVETYLTMNGDITCTSNGLDLEITQR